MNLCITVAVVFVMLGVAVVAIAGGVVWAIVRSMGEPPAVVWTAVVGYGSVAILALIGMITAAWAFLHLRLILPLLTLTRSAENLSRLDFAGAIEPSQPHIVGALVKAVYELGSKLRLTRAEVYQAVATATAQVEDIKNRLEAILFDFSYGVVVCNLKHQILLYNQGAVRILGNPEMLGLGRSLFRLLTREPVLHTLEQLTYRHAEGRRRPAELTEPFVCATADAHTLLHARMSLIRGGQDDPTGYVVTFADASHDVAVLAKHDALLRTATEGLRAPVANLRAAAETLTVHSDLEPDKRAAIEAVIHTESATLSRRLEALAAEYHDLIGRQWLMSRRVLGRSPQLRHSAPGRRVRDRGHHGRDTPVAARQQSRAETHARVSAPPPS